MTRAASTALATLLLTAVTLVTAGAVGVFAVDLGPGSAPGPPHRVTAAVNATDGRITLVHASGPPLDVRTLDLRIAVDGRPLRSQPPVPYYSAPGFRRFPAGPFNPAGDPEWAVGERAVVTATGPNREPIVPDVVVRVEVYRGDRLLAVASTRAR